jgi:hypothetical protein
MIRSALLIHFKMYSIVHAVRHLTIKVTWPPGLWHLTRSGTTVSIGEVPKSRKTVGGQVDLLVRA